MTNMTDRADLISTAWRAFQDPHLGTGSFPSKYGSFVAGFEAGFDASTKCRESQTVDQGGVVTTTDNELLQSIAIRLHAVECGCSDYIGVGDEDSVYEEIANALMPIFTAALAAAPEDAWLKGWHAGWVNRHGAHVNDEGNVGAQLPVVNPYALRRRVAQEGTL